MSSTDTVITIHPECSPEYDTFKPKGPMVNTKELLDRPVINRENTDLRNFLAENQVNENIGYDGEVDTLRLLGRVYNKIMTFSVVTRYAFYIIPVAAILAIPLTIFATVQRHRD